MNAIPSDFRMLRAGRSGMSSIREDAGVTGLSASRFGALASSSDCREGETLHIGDGSTGGTRHAKRARRGADFARPAAQGRSGRKPRQIALHLEFQPLHLAATLTQPGVEPSRRSLSAQAEGRPDETVRHSTSRGQAQPLPCSSASVEVRGTKLVPSSGCAIADPARGRTRGKGVLAA